MPGWTCSRSCRPAPSPPAGRASWCWPGRSWSAPGWRWACSWGAPARCGSRFRRRRRAPASARWRWAPQLSASGSIFAADVPYPTGQKDGWRVTVDLAWPLYDGGYRYGRARQAEAALSGAESARALERLQVGEEVQNAVRDVAVARERVRLGERQQEAAAEAAASARRSFGAGVAGSIEVLDRAVGRAP